ncbi:MAG: tetratricopeptide repeat protein [Planctomycetota bacterium]|nr:MAG: tetratricopeptide repeat protein [Planctomycetota bacterium]
MGPRARLRTRGPGGPPLGLAPRPRPSRCARGARLRPARRPLAFRRRRGAPRRQGPLQEPLGNPAGEGAPPRRGARAARSAPQGSRGAQARRPSSAGGSPGGRARGAPRAPARLRAGARPRACPPAGGCGIRRRARRRHLRRRPLRRLPHPLRQRRGGDRRLLGAHLRAAGHRRLAHPRRDLPHAHLWRPPERLLPGEPVGRPVALRLLRALALALGLAGALFCAPAARADEVHLVDGTVLRGDVVEGTDPEGPLVVAVEREGQRALVEVPRAEVRRVRRLSDVEERLLARASEALLAARPTQAVAFLEQLVARRPTDPTAHRELGFALLMAGELQQALAPLEEACALDPIDVDARLLLAQAYERAARPGDAIEAYRRAVRAGPRHVRAWRALARLLLRRGAQGDREEALDALRRASAEDPLDEATALAWAAALLPDRRAEARAVLRAFVGRAPTSPAAARALAKLEAMDGRAAEARALLAPALAREDLPLSLRERLRAEDALYAWLAADRATPSPEGTDAAALADPDRLAAAERRLAWQLELLPDEGRLHLALARVLLRAGRVAAARAELERAALAGPPPVAEDALLLQEAALALERAALVPNAPRDLLGPKPSVARTARLAALLPWRAEAHTAHGAALEREGHFAAAAEAYRTGAARVPEPAARERLAGLAARAAAEAARKRRNEGT